MLFLPNYGHDPKKKRIESMKKTYSNRITRLLSLVLALFIVAAMALALVSCGDKKNDGKTTDTVKETVTDTAAPDTAGNTEAAGTESDKAQITITVTVKFADETTKDFVITTSEEFLRGALEQENLVEGDESEYGLYVKTVDGVTADYEADKAYWAFYKDGEYLMTGVDTTPIADGDTFSFEYTKG